ncbi:ABC transporter substrate-binding protein [Bordetella trematum]|uniref:ABC transporter substrate-binding protein n=1 Tax=Bordetella trematum TaxID=123899 RepID=UPI000D92371C|nr:ABC transporter substrate-binding protein [Bordetella trematum]SPU48691.1 nitrate/sulfonate/bicarbonate ABC transporter substrate-binding protein [Bordetella trematum]VDH04994.1 ABC-type taurine transport system, periplasmic component [Bordetella trematum]
MSTPVESRLQRFLSASVLALFIVLLALSAPTPVQAEGRLRIAEQHGIVYLLLNIARDRQLIEKHGKEAGIDIEVQWKQLSGGAAINDALLSGAIDIGAAGVGPLLTLWDRTRGRQNVKGVASLGNFPSYLVSINPQVRSIADFTERDRIALPAVGVSVQSRLLQLASAKLWGKEHFNRLDKISVALPHPDAAAALIAGGTEITAHFANAPFQEQELAANPQAHVVLNSYDVLGGPASSTVLFATEAFRDRNPKTYAAFQAALAEAARFAATNPEAAADAYLRVSGSKIDRELLVRIIKSPEVAFTLAPRNTYPLAEFMHEVGAIKNKPESWQAYFFDDALVAQGS